MSWQNVLNAVSSTAGAFNPAVGLVTGAAGAIKGLFGGNDSRKQNLALMQQQNAFNRDERIAAQGWQDMQRREQNAFSEYMWNNYQSPDALVRQYTEAGLNPRLAVEGSGSPGVSSGSSGSSPMAQAVAPPYMPYSAPGNYSDVANTLKALADAAKAGFDVRRGQTLLDEELKKLRLGNQAQELMNILSSIDIKYKDAKSSAELHKILVDVGNGILSGQELREKIKSLDINNRMDKNRLDKWFEKYEAELAKLNSETNLNQTASNLNVAETKTEGFKQDNLAASTNLLQLQGVTEQQQQAINAPLVAVANLQYDEIKTNLKTQANIKKAFRESYAVLSQMPGVDLKKAEKELELLNQESTWKDPEKLGGILGSLTGAVISGAITAKIVKGMFKGKTPTPPPPMGGSVSVPYN